MIGRLELLPARRPGTLSCIDELEAPAVGVAVAKAQPQSQPVRDLFRKPFLERYERLGVNDNKQRPIRKQCSVVQRDQSTEAGPEAPPGFAGAALDKEVAILQARVAVYSEADIDCMHVQFADEAICIGPAPGASSYLNIAAIMSAAEITDVEAIHPGYGFLAENAHFAEICESCSISFIGPTPENIRLLGDKMAAKEKISHILRL